MMKILFFCCRTLSNGCDYRQILRYMMIEKVISCCYNKTNVDKDQKQSTHFEQRLC